MNTKVYRAGRFNGQSGKYDEVTSVDGFQFATIEKIETLNADPLGGGVEVGADKIVDGWFDPSR
ncbi:hypothetical protein ACVI1J_009894 [Bradyrhizobium diazoefficiens]